MAATSSSPAPRRPSSIAPDWWDYTTLDAGIVAEAARLKPKDLLALSRPGFRIAFYQTREEFYLAEALEYVEAWKESTVDNPVGVCGPIGPTEQLPLVARIVNALGVDVRSGHFWGIKGVSPGIQEATVNTGLFRRPQPPPFPEPIAPAGPPTAANGRSPTPGTARPPTPTTTPTASSPSPAPPWAMA